MSNEKTLSLYRRKNGVWYILIYTDGIPQWKTTKCKKKSDALKVLTQFEQVERTKQAPKSLTTFTDEFLSNAVGNYTSGTIDIYRKTLKVFRTIVTNKKLQDVSLKDIDNFKTARLHQVKAVTVNIELRALRSIFNTAKNWELIEANPFVGVQLVRVADSSKTYFSHENFQQLMETIQEEWLRDVVLFAVLTGLRRGEIINLNWQQVDLNRKWVSIQSSEHYQTKQGKFRTLPLGEAAYQLLMKRRELFNDGLVFQMDGGRPISGYWATHKLKQYIRKLGLDDKLHFHSLRHSCASWLAADGVSIYHIAKLLGHTTVSTTEKFYAHLQPESLRETVNRIAV